MRFTRPHSRLAAAAVTILMVLLGPQAAAADVGETIILRCTHGESLAGFSQAAYRQALKELSADAEEYTPCSNQIRQAQLAAAGSGAGSQAGSATVAAPTPVAVTPSERRSLARAGSTGAPVRVGGNVVNPGVVHANVSSALSTLPGPLLAAIGLIAACLAVFLATAVRNRIRGQRPD